MNRDNTLRIFRSHGAAPGNSLFYAHSPLNRFTLGFDTQVRAKKTYVPKDHLYSGKANLFCQKVEESFTPLDPKGVSIETFALRTLTFFSLIQAKQLKHAKLSTTNSSGDGDFSNDFECACFMHTYQDKKSGLKEILKSFSLNNSQDPTNSDEKIKHIAALFITFLLAIEKIPVAQIIYLKDNGISGDILKREKADRERLQMLEDVPERPESRNARTVEVVTYTSALTLLALGAAKFFLGK